MSQQIKIFLLVFVLSLPFFWGANYFEKELKDFLFWHKISQQPEILLAQIALEEEWREMKPVKKGGEKELAFETEAKSAVSFLISDKEGQDKERILFEKEAQEQLPIASLTKLMTAWVVLEHYDLSEKIIISEQAASQYGDIKNLEKGRVFTVEYLLYPLLMQSSNGAAFALANDYPSMTEKSFVELMNKEAQKIGMAKTFFYNPSGLDPYLDNLQTETNYSTGQDLVRLVKNLLAKPLVWEILSLARYSEYGPELTNTNRFLLNNETDWQERIVGGKTGYTKKAGGCLLLVVKAPRNHGFLVNIVLGTENKDVRFEEMRKLIDWLKVTYKW